MKTFIALDIAIKHHQSHTPTISAIVKKEFYGRDTEHAYTEKERVLDFLLRYFPTDTTVTSLTPPPSLLHLCDPLFAFFLCKCAQLFERHVEIKTE